MDYDPDPFNERDKIGEATGGTDTTDERIPLIPMGGEGDSQIDPSGEQETSFGGGVRMRTEVLKDQVKGLYEKLTKHFKQNPEVLHYDLFELKGKDLYFKDLDIPLTRRGRLKTEKTLGDILGVRKLREMGFDIPIGVTARQLFDEMNKIQKELPSASDIERANDPELIEMTEIAISADKHLLNESFRGTQTGEDDPGQPTMRELMGLDKELRSIRGSLKVEVAKKVELEQKLEKEKAKLETLKNSTDLDQDGELKRVIEAQVSKLEEDLKVRQESIDLLKGRLTDQITSFKETIAKVLDKDKSLGERIRTLFREQGITIFSILTAIGMAVGVLVEAVLPRSTAASTTAHGGGGDTPGSAKEWIRNKLKALASLLGKLAEKLGSALPGIIGSVVAWLLNRAKEVVGWISKNLWSLVLLCVWMVYDYMKKK